MEINSKLLLNLISNNNMRNVHKLNTSFSDSPFSKLNPTFTVMCNVMFQNRRIDKISKCLVPYMYVYYM